MEVLAPLALLVNHVLEQQPQVLPVLLVSIVLMVLINVYSVLSGISAIVGIHFH